MAGSFDIEVVVAGRRELIVECKMTDDPATLDAATTQLRAYMRRASIFSGLVVTPRFLRILRDTFAASEEPIEIVGEFDVSTIKDLRRPEGRTASFEFEANVQRWLESFAFDSNVEALPEPLRAGLIRYVVPLVQSGYVSASGPREIATRRAG